MLAVYARADAQSDHSFNVYIREGVALRERTGEMDPIAGREIVAKLVELNRKSKVTMIVASHGAFPYTQTDRTLFIKDGKIVSQKEAGY